MSLQSVSYRERSLTVSWAPSAGATSYRILVQSGNQSSQLGQFTTTGTSFDLRDLPVSPSTEATPTVLAPAAQICIEAVNDAGMSPCVNWRLVMMPDFKDMVDALIFSRGRYSHSRISERLTWWGFRAGSSVSIRISSSVSGQASAIRRLVDQINQVLPGLYQISIDEPGVSLDDMVRSRQFVPGQIIVVAFDDPDRLSTCGPSAAACAPLSRTGEFSGAHVVISTRSGRPEPVVQHELAHALLGLAHLYFASVSAPGWEIPIMHEAFPIGTYVGQFAELEVEILRAIFQAGLRPGHTRDDFRARGLVQ